MISVCMATYNGERYLREQVDSILMQLNGGDELIVSDDGSTDDTLEILRGYNDDRIKIFNNKRKGIVGNFENAISRAKGDYIFLADQDDVWIDGKVKKCVAMLNNADLVLHDAIITDANMQSMITDSFFELRHSKKGYLQNLFRNSYIGCCMAFRASLLPKILPFPLKIAMHDIWIGLRAQLYGKVQLIEIPLIKYRRHDKNASPTGSKSNLTKSSRIIYRLRMLFYTITK